MRSPLLLRIVVPSLAVSLALLTLGIVSAWYVHTLQQGALRVQVASVERLVLAEKMVSATRQVRFYLNRFSVSADRENLEAVSVADRTMSDYLTKAEALPALEDGKQLLPDIRRERTELTQQLEKLRTDPLKDSRKAARQLAEDLVAQRMLTPGQRFGELSRAAAGESGKRVRAVADRSVLSLLLLGTCGSVAGLVAGFAVARAVRMSILELYVPIRMAEGKLEEVVGPVRLEKPGNVDEIDSLLENLAGRIETVVDRLQQSQLHLLRAEQFSAVGQLAAGLAHELRNPLMAIKILIQAAAETGGTGCLEGRDLSVLSEEVDRLDRSLQRFLDFARPPRLERHLFDVRGALQQTLDLVAARAARQGVQIQKNVPDEPVELHADPEQIRQVFLNVILNALDMLPQGGNIFVGTTVGEPPQGRAQAANEPAVAEKGSRVVSITIGDDGPGIPEDIGQRIFDPFVSTKETGLGLGLAICRRILAAHDGTITATNRPDGGAEFAIRLPAAAKTKSGQKE